MSPSFSAKNKIIALCAAWILVSLSMYFYFFGIMNNKNQATLDEMGKDRQTLFMLEAENQSFKQAQADLDKMDKEPIKPEDFFSKDISLVKEIQVLEDLDGKYNTEVNFSGVSGIINSNSGTAGTATALVLVPYSISINGSLNNVVDLIENFENLTFITKTTSLSLTSSGEGKVSASLGSGFYVKNK